MDRRRWLILAGAVLLAFLIFFGGPVVVDLVVRGARLTRATWSDADPLTIAEDPEDLAEAASDVAGQVIGVDEYALARMVRSEQPRGSSDVSTALVHTALNDARAHGWTVLHTVTVSSVASRTGRFGNQTTRRYSTKDDPFDGDLYVVRVAMAMHAGGDDVTGGALKFVDRDAFSGGKYDAVVAAWAKEGLTPYNLPGLPSDQVFFRRGAA